MITAEFDDRRHDRGVDVAELLEPMDAQPVSITDVGSLPILQVPRG